MRLSRDGKVLYSCSGDNTIISWNTLTSNIIRVFEGHIDWV